MSAPLVNLSRAAEMSGKAKNRIRRRRDELVENSAVSRVCNGLDCKAKGERLFSG